MTELDGERQRDVETREWANMIVVIANPSGVVDAAEGVFAWDRTNKKLYINNNGATGWTNIV